MRAVTALTLLVSFTDAGFAQDWAELHRGGVDAVRQNRFGAASELLQKSVDAAQTAPQRAISLNDVGVALHRTGREAEARVALRKSLAVWRSQPGQENARAQTAGALATVERLLGDYSAAETVLAEALRMPGVDADRKSYLLSTQGDIFREEGRFGEARDLLLEASRLNTTPAQRLNNKMILAALDSDMQSYAPATAEWHAAVAMAHDQKQDRAEAICLRGLGQTWLDQRNYARAEPLLRRALALLESSTDREDTELATALTSLGELYVAEDKTGMGEEALERALAIEEKSMGPDHPQVALILEGLARSFAVRRQGDLARDAMERVQRIMTARFGEKSPMVAGVAANWGEIEKRLNRPDLAALRFHQALKSLGEGNPDLEPLRQRILGEYASVLKGTHGKREASSLLPH